MNGRDFDMYDMREMAGQIASNIKLDTTRWTNFNKQLADSVAQISAEKALNKIRVR